MVDPIFGAHHAFEIKADAVGAGIVEREAAFGEARDNARAVAAPRARFLDPPELHRVPLDPPAIVAPVKPHRALPAADMSDALISDPRVRQPRHTDQTIAT